MTRRIKLILGAALLVLPVMWTTSFAAEKPISLKWAGTVADTAIDVNGDGFFADVIYAQAKGPFGAKSIGVFSEFVLTGLCDNNEDVLYLSVWYSKPVITFANGDQLWGNVTGGWMCMNIKTGEFTGEAEGLYEGGTGRFADATGSFFVPFGGNNLTISKLGVGFGAIHGELTGTVVLP